MRLFGTGCHGTYKALVANSHASCGVNQMKRTLSLFAIVLALTGCDAGQFGSNPPPPASGRAEWLIGRIKALTDAGVLYEPDKVARTLSLTFQASGPETRQPFSNCTNPYDSSSDTINYTPQERSWYGTTPEGISHMPRPGFAINPPAIMGDPKFTYTVSTHKSCTGWAEPKEYTEAKIDFSYVSGYACITPQILNKVSPEAKYVYATDGAAPYYYTGKFDDKSKTTAEFGFFAGTQCMISIAITQSDKSGKRFLRAKTLFLQCKRKADHDYCATHGSFGWGDGNKSEAMDDFAIKSCGTVNSYFQKEPLSGKEPESLPLRGYPKTPCDQ
jgi:hypothetical protein